MVLYRSILTQSRIERERAKDTTEDKASSVFLGSHRERKRVDTPPKLREMAILPIHHPLLFAFGLLGNIISFMVYLAPLPTFHRVYKKKSTEGFQCFPYLVALLSAMLWLYYALYKSGANLLITINSVGLIIESTYIIMYFVYAPKKARIQTLGLLLSMNVGAFGSIVLVSQFFLKGSTRVRVLGWVCSAFSVSGFAAPLSITRKVIRTKSVEYMPFSLSFFLTLSAVMWFGYGMQLKDMCIALPNVLGFIFGVLQMILYMMYKNHSKTPEDEKLPEYMAEIKKQTIVAGPEVHPVTPLSGCDETAKGEDQKSKDQTAPDHKKGTDASDQV